MGMSAWELLASEHGIQKDGTFLEGNTMNDNVTTFFSDTRAGKIVPRNLFVDLEQSVISEIQTGEWRALFNPSFMIQGKEDAAK
jgi:tubulin alpha